jgi:hypothetical protein
MWLLGLVVGLLVGVQFGRDLWPIAGVIGALAGWAVGFKLYPEGRLGGKVKALSTELQNLTQRLAALEAAFPRLGVSQTTSHSPSRRPARRTYFAGAPARVDARCARSQCAGRRAAPRR